MSISKHEIYVKALLEGYYELYEKRHSGLWHLSDEMMDLEEAISRADLTSKQQEVIDLYFGKQLNQDETSRSVGVSRQMVAKHLSTSVKKIANIYEKWEALENVS